MLILFKNKLYPKITLSFVDPPRPHIYSVISSAPYKEAEFKKVKHRNSEVVWI